MNKISPLDIRIAVLAYPLVAKGEEAFIPKVSKPIVPFRGDDRIVSLFQNSPKAPIEPSRSKLPPIFRKAQFALIRMFEILKILLQEKKSMEILSDIAPPRRLLVPQLPHPRFQTPKLPRFFWHPAYVSPKDEYSPSPLISEAKEDIPKAVYNSPSICAYARCALPKKGILRQDNQGFVYLELPNDFITTLFPLINDCMCKTMPLHQIEPSPAHIPVILPHEWATKKGWGEIKEIQQAISFEITQLSSLSPKRWFGVEKVYFLNVKSPELEQLRQRYQLPSLIRGHDFLIAIAYKKTAQELKASNEIFRLNVSCYAA